MEVSTHKNKMKIQTFHHVFDPIIQLYGGKKIELDYETPFQLLCAVILSAQTTDKQVNRITPPFFKKVRVAQDILSLSLEEIESDLKYVNFYKNKSRFIQQTGRILAEKYDGTIPNDLVLLQTFPGIGVKTAKVILSVLYDMPYVWVDTHIHRVMNRLGIVTTKTPEQTDKKIDILFDRATKKSLHHPLVLFWRYHCIARKPKCETCPVKKYCKYYEKSVSESVVKP